MSAAQICIFVAYTPLAQALAPAVPVVKPSLYYIILLVFPSLLTCWSMRETNEHNQNCVEPKFYVILISTISLHYH